MFAAFTDPGLIPRWWGPHGTTTTVDEMDVRAGGSRRFVSHDSDGSETAFRGTYREVRDERDLRPPRRAARKARVRLTGSAPACASGAAGDQPRPRAVPPYAPRSARKASTTKNHSMPVTAWVPTSHAIA